MVGLTRLQRVTAYRIILVTISLALIVTACLEDPDRTHPLDPLGENFLDEGGIAVQVTNFYPPRSGLVNIKVTVSPGIFTGDTDAEGRFVLPGLPGGTYTVEIEKPGYASLDTLVEVTAGDMSELELPLAGLPTFTNFEVNSLHISRWFPPPEELFSLEVLAEVADKDGVADIDSIWVVIDDLDFAELLLVQVEPGKYVHSIQSAGLPARLPALLGQQIQLMAKDRSGVSNSSLSKSLIRVINETPLAIDPRELALIDDPQPTFTWEPITLEFPYTFRIDVVRIDQNIQSTVQTIKGISSSSTTFTAPEHLLSGEYFWTVSIVDEFGNRSRSREAGFRIR